MINEVKKTWGQELWLINTELYCGKILLCEKGKWSSRGKYHFHLKKDETFYVLNGKVFIDIEGTGYLLTQNDQIRIKPGERHRFQAISKLARILEVSTHHEDSDSYRVGGLEYSLSKS